ncbi:MAG: hypothetical protein GTO24_15890 [candidate division Zixibacteria bacterium]|nr:hypothetical protein [candidate division Zixibacteria bacterium]
MAPEFRPPKFPSPVGYVSCLCSSIVTRPWPAFTSVAQQRPTWLISGTMGTNGGGETDLAVHDFLDVPACANAISDHYGPAVIKPGLFVTTPMHDAPVVLTYTLNATEQDLGFMYRDVFDGRLIARQRTEWEIIVKVRSWNLAGDPLENVDFSWIYIAEAALRYRVV